MRLNMKKTYCFVVVLVGCFFVDVFSKDYSFEPVANILESIEKLDQDAVVPHENLMSILLASSKVKYAPEDIRLVLQEAWAILEKYYNKVEASQLLDWYGKLVAFSLECGIRDDVPGGSPDRFIRIVKNSVVVPGGQVVWSVGGDHVRTINCTVYCV